MNITMEEKFEQIADYFYDRYVVEYVEYSPYRTFNGAVRISAKDWNNHLKELVDNNLLTVELIESLKTK